MLWIYAVVREASSTVHKIIAGNDLAEMFACYEIPYHDAISGLKALVEIQYIFTLLLVVDHLVTSAINVRTPAQ